MSENLTRSDVEGLLEHLEFVEVEEFHDWKRYRAGREGIQSLIVDMSRDQYLFDDICDDLIRVGVPRDDVIEAYQFMKTVG